ncbi:MAG: hypothetical protein M9921_13660 [Fimbriimonadaceae bacterium]|nr:hypothetical protein [Fimbriimonadaceae bacterium]
MVAFLAALFLAAPGLQGESLLHQVVPRPTGKNGYEEYVKAAEILDVGDAGFYLSWQPGTSKRLEQEAKASVEDGIPVPADPEAARLLPLARRLEAMSTLEIRTEIVRKFGVALDWVKQGNQKPVFNPRPTISATTLFPELAKFRMLAKLAVAAAYVHDAEGRSAEGTDALLQILDMGDRIGGFTLISMLVGVSEQSIALSAMQSRLDRLSQPEASTVSALVARLLARPPVVLEAMRGEVRFISASLEELLAKPEEFTGDEDAVLGKLNTLSAQDRARLAALVRKRLDQTYAPILDRLAGPESGWVFMEPDPPDPPTGAQSVEDLADVLLTWLVPVTGQIGTSAARMRTQLRLLGLGARVIAFKWEHERLPTRLEDAAPAAELDDPLSGDKFQYTPMGDRFRVFSKGVPATGEIDIKYVRGQGTGGPPPPGPTAAKQVAR